MDRFEYLNKLENIKKHSGSVEEASNAHEYLLCDYVKSLEKQLEKLTPYPIDLVNMNVGDLVLLYDHGRTTLHYVTFYGEDKKISEFWNYEGNITKLDGTFCYLRENGRSIAAGEINLFAIKVFHNYDIRFKCTSDR